MVGLHRYVVVTGSGPAVDPSSDPIDIQAREGNILVHKDNHGGQHYIFHDLYNKYILLILTWAKFITFVPPSLCLDKRGLMDEMKTISTFNQFSCRSMIPVDHK